MNGFYATTATIDGKKYTTVGLAVQIIQMTIQDLTGRVAFENLMTEIQATDVVPILCHPAPPHKRADFTGGISLNSAFWNECWWPGVSGRDKVASNEWKRWLLEGGIMVPIDGIEADAFRVQYERQLTDERWCRTQFQQLWPATDVLGWIISRNDAQIEKFADKSSLLSNTPVCAWHVLNDIAEGHCVPGLTPEELSLEKYRQTFAAHVELVRALQNEELKAWRWKAPKGPAVELMSTDFLGAKYLQDNNACGLLGFGDLSSFVVMRPKEVRTLWPVRGTPAVANIAASEQSLGAKPIDTSLAANVIAARAPAVKAGRAPDDAAIRTKADEMKARGLGGYALAKKMRLEPGFENVATTTVRGLIKGRWPPSGRPKKPA